MAEIIQTLNSTQPRMEEAVPLSKPMRWHDNLCPQLAATLSDKTMNYVKIVNIDKTDWIA